MAEDVESTLLEEFKGGAADLDAIDALAGLVMGCRNDVDGISSKKHIIKRHVASGKGDLLQVLCGLHARKVLVIPHEKLFDVLRFRKGNKLASGAKHPGYFLATALAACDNPAEMPNVVTAYINTNPKLDQIALYAYINDHGFVEYSSDEVSDLVRYTPPTEDGQAVAPWKIMWGINDEKPEGKPWFGRIRDSRGRTAKLCFLGSLDPESSADGLTPPSEVLSKSIWKVPKPAMCITVDAGSMHPRQLDSISRMANLPQFVEWVDLQTGKTASDVSSPATASAGSSSKSAKVAPAAEELGIAPAEEDAATSSVDPERKLNLMKKFREAAMKGMSPKVKLKTLLHLSLKEWRHALAPTDTDDMLGDGSINNVIFTKVKEVFAALLDAAYLAQSWVIVDRTDGSGSATAEILLEMALERITNKPTILVIDSLERLGNAKEGARANKIIKQLHDMFQGEDYVSQDPVGSERDFPFDYKYELDEYFDARTFASIPDEKLPFPILPDHQRKAYGGTCDPMRKWRYVYVDALFASGTHIVLKNNDRDEFNVEEAGTQGFLYAHGDSRTYKRLRANIQSGKPIVMLHNSGGVVTAFSWLQRVMAYTRPPPNTEELSGPLRFIIANLSEANWTHDFGVPEMLMMRSLAERAPMLFRKNVISVDILTESEEQTLEAITGCFAQSGGVPELGLGNAEVNVIFTTWMLHLTLCENARRFHRRSVIYQWIFWILSINTTLVAVVDSSFGAGVLRLRIGEARGAPYTDEELEPIREDFATVIILLPIVSALVVTISARMKWRDKWSVCVMCADTLASEIYKFRMQTVEYDMSGSPGKDEDGMDLPPLPPKEKARRARALFVDRIQNFHQACITELSQSASLRPTKAGKKYKVGKTQQFVERMKRDDKPTLSTWYKLKIHVENHFYRASWAFPQGTSFLTWISGLRPYLSQRAMKEEMKSTIQNLSETGGIVLKGSTPLSESESKKIRHKLATSLGLPPTLFDGVRDELRVLQRKVVLELAKEEEKKNLLKQKKDAEKADAAAPSAGAGVMTPRQMMAGASAMVAGAIGSSGPKQSGEDELVTLDAMRELIMEMQGQGKPREDDSAALQAAKKRAKKLGNVAKTGTQVDDDYLAGPLTIDSYMCYRVRPLMDMLERRSTKLSWRLTVLEITVFAIQASGSICGAFAFTEWTALTVACAAVIQGFIEFVQLRDQVTSVNLALKDLQSLAVLWDSLSIVKRRTPGVKMQVVKTTEDAMLMVVQAHTTASSNTITSVGKSMAAEVDEDENQEE